MLAALLLLQAAPAAIKPPAPPVTDAMLERLVRTESRLDSRLWNQILDDPALRAEIRRVGFVKGCRALSESRIEVRQRHDGALVGPSVRAIRTVIGEVTLDKLWPMSFVTGPLYIRRARIDAELERTAGDQLAAATRDMQATFLRRTGALPDTKDPKDNIVMPKPDMAAALGIKGGYNLDKPGELGLACAEMLISPAARPTITTGPSSYVVEVVPPDAAKR